MNNDWRGLTERHLGLKVFQADPELLEEVFYNGCGIYGDSVLHFYTDKLTEGTFSIMGEPSSDIVWEKLKKLRLKFEEGEL